MKSLEYYLNQPYRMVIVPDETEGGYTVYFPELPGCATCVEKMDDVYAEATDAKKAWLTAALEDGVIINEPQADIGKQVGLLISDSLRNKISEKAASEGKSFNDYCVVELEKAVAV